ncbi:hypothetical protein A0H81_03474 [Grifola frondosa]|uniref:DUF6534 domain-containing protein n=1 Tax=Grifola frondosa TaxID=5627 RepID=A0A1C7MHN4_GRIFR|nr:hypothetical protein A0H81_03474 [Grifola frondosa]
MFIGLCVTCILYGITTLQTFNYIQTYKEDPPLLKAMVSAVWVAETLQTIFSIQYMYMYVIRHFGDVVFMSRIYWSGGVALFFGIVVELIAQSFYIRRIWILSGRSVTTTAPLAFLVVCRFGFGTATSALGYIVPTWAILVVDKTAVMTVSVGQGCSAIVDIIMASILIYYLRQGRGCCNRSDNMLTLLIIYVVNTGALTSVFSILVAIMFGAQHRTLLFLSLSHIEYKLYANSFLGSLNVRQYIRRHGGNWTYPAMSLLARPPTAAAPSSGIEVTVHQETQMMNDELNYLESDIALEFSRGKV